MWHRCAFGMLVDECEPDMADGIGECVRSEISAHQMPDAHYADEACDIVHDVWGNGQTQGPDRI